MSDSISSCIVYKNLDGTIDGYDITFSLEGVDGISIQNVIHINSSMLSNSNDLIETKTVACQKAKIVKDSYSTIATIITDLNGPVIL